MTITHRARTSEDGILRLEVPTGRANEEVLVSIDAVAPDPACLMKLEELFGSITDPTFVRPEQPPMQLRPGLD